MIHGDDYGTLADFLLEKHDTIWAAIRSGDKSSTPVFVEKHLSKRGNANPVTNFLLGSGTKVVGSVDAVIWSEGEYFLDLSTDSSGPSSVLLHVRTPTDLSRDHEEGVVNEKEVKDGLISIPNKRGKRPLKITLDLTTSYVNTAYPADTYPVFRHYEWFDENRDGIGNSLMLTYSEKTNHECWINTKKIGDVKLYDEPFQEIDLLNLEGQIQIKISQPKSVENMNVTYGIKGPWKIIYFIEW